MTRFCRTLCTYYLLLLTILTIMLIENKQPGPPILRVHLPLLSWRDRTWVPGRGSMRGGDPSHDHHHFHHQQHHHFHPNSHDHITTIMLPPEWMEGKFVWWNSSSWSITKIIIKIKKSANLFCFDVVHTAQVVIVIFWEAVGNSIFYHILFFF